MILRRTAQALDFLRSLKTGDWIGLATTANLLAGTGGQLRAVGQADAIARPVDQRIGQAQPEYEAQQKHGAQPIMRGLVPARPITK